MKISVDSDRGILLEEVFSGVGLKTRDGEFMGICMRDSGFEFSYEGHHYSAQKGVIRKIDIIDDECQNHDKLFHGDITNYEE